MSTLFPSVKLHMYVADDTRMGIIAAMGRKRSNLVFVLGITGHWRNGFSVLWGIF